MVLGNQINIRLVSGKGVKRTIYTDGFKAPWKTEDETYGMRGLYNCQYTQTHKTDICIIKQRTTTIGEEWKGNFHSC